MALACLGTSVRYPGCRILLRAESEKENMANNTLKVDLHVLFHVVPFSVKCLVSSSHNPSRETTDISGYVPLPSTVAHSQGSAPEAAPTLLIWCWLEFSQYVMGATNKFGPWLLNLLKMSLCIVQTVFDSRDLNTELLGLHNTLFCYEPVFLEKSPC